MPYQIMFVFGYEIFLKYLVDSLLPENYIDFKSKAEKRRINVWEEIFSTFLYIISFQHT